LEGLTRKTPHSLERAVDRYDYNPNRQQASTRDLGKCTKPKKQSAGWKEKTARQGTYVRTTCAPHIDDNLFGMVGMMPTGTSIRKGISRYSLRTPPNVLFF